MLLASVAPAISVFNSTCVAQRRVSRPPSHFLWLCVSHVSTCTRIFHCLNVELLFFACASGCFAASLQRTVRNLSVINRGFLASRSIFQQFAKSKRAIGDVHHRIFPTLFLFRVIRENVFCHSGRVVFRVNCVIRELTAFPCFRRCVRSSLLYPLFHVRVMMNCAGRAIRTGVVGTARDDLKVLLFSPPWVFPCLLLYRHLVLMWPTRG